MGGHILPKNEQNISCLALYVFQGYCMKPIRIGQDIADTDEPLLKLLVLQDKALFPVIVAATYNFPQSSYIYRKH